MAGAEAKGCDGGGGGGGYSGGGGRPPGTMPAAAAGADCIGLSLTNTLETASYNSGNGEVSISRSSPNPPRSRSYGAAAPGLCRLRLAGAAEAVVLLICG